jgi:hypothetical protein
LNDYHLFNKNQEHGNNDGSIGRLPDALRSIRRIVSLVTAGDADRETKNDGLE